MDLFVFLWEEGPILYIIKVTQRALFVFNFFFKLTYDDYSLLLG